MTGCAEPQAVIVRIKPNQQVIYNEKKSHTYRSKFSRVLVQP